MAGDGNSSYIVSETNTPDESSFFGWKLLSINMDTASIFGKVHSIDHLIFIICLTESFV